jgi:hypothetical protein|tara:strand:+ start:1647 stop:1859 length:213 start_codon:yes stop_codon:yes gene_type:complete
MKTSTLGYIHDSPDVNNKQNIIQGNHITMKGVEFKVLGTDDRGYTKIMYPGYDYVFPGAKYVIEKPLKNV